ncbi:MAG: tetratricopeptide repeat protein [Paludibacteraceae bacterium]|nr:tetratricopeptide repeat protein [Paludibacteraceae bacterium]
MNHEQEAKTYHFRLRRIILICLGSWFLALGSAFAQLNTDRITAIGRNALYFDDYVLSIQYFNQVIKLKPYLSEPYLLRAIAKIQLGDYTGAEIDCNAAIERNPFQPGAYYTRGYIYRQTGQLENAEQDFSEALIFAPENRTYLAMRADVLAELERYDLALQDINHLLHREPQSASLHFEKGSICLRSNDTLCALNAFTHATEYDSQNPANWSALGLVQLMQDHQDEALHSLSKAIEHGSKWAGDYINRGIIYYRKHNYRSALVDYDKAVTLSPHDAQCYYNRGVLRQELGDYNRALEDFTQAISFAPERIELYYQRGMVQLQLRQWQDALTDFNIIIERYPYFLPSYYLAAQAEASLGHDKEAYQLRQQAYNLEQKKDSIQSLQTDMQVADNQPRQRDNRKEFSALAAQNQETNNEEITYDSDTRGAVQKRYTDVINEPNIFLSYYATSTNANALRQTNYSHATVDAYNRTMHLPAPLRFTTQEIPLTADIVNQHFTQISNLSHQIDHLEHMASPNTQNNAQLCAAYIARAFEFALVQDYSSALDDVTRSILIDGTLYFAYFCRANWRYKLLEYKRAIGESTDKADFELMMRDYDYVINHTPDFSFAYYNKANMLCIQQDFKAAITYYTQAIAIDSDFAEAYFNRGLTYIYIGQNEKGIIDLSKAGELGIYQAYNLISRFQ